MLKLWIYCFLTFVLLGCTPAENIRPETAAVKNVILIIGDGMGPQQVGLLLSYARQAPHSVIANRMTALDRMMEHGRLGIAMTYTAGALVADSAASGTQLATGLPAGPEMLGLDQDGNRQENIIEKARRMGKATGLVSDTRMTHATPAAFAAHQTHRSQENDIAEDLLASQADVMLSGGLDYWIPQQAATPLLQLTGNGFAVKSKRKDNKDLLKLAQQQGYTLAFNKAQLQKAKGKTLGLFADAAMPDGIAETRLREDVSHSRPTLREMSAKALDILDDNERGFFLMIEAGQIDWASHRNDTGLLLHEMLRFNDMLNEVLGWAANRQDTLIIVTADHETGGFGFSYSAENIPQPRKLPGAVFANSLFQPGFNFGSPDVLDKLYAQQLSYRDIFNRFDALPLPQQTPSKLVELVNRYTEFKITEAQAVDILTTEDNPFFHAGHGALGARRVPRMDVNGAFFVYQQDNRENLLARAVAASQQVVWATGTHTSTPVYVFAQGPEASTKPFAGILHHTQIGRLISDALH
ncbi:alkaline phosphatase [Methylobacter sp.]|uniref:alkaline phosphatase n=1 Tax=Methylobacter sp. TaxID=2051955 RepID=UPI003DA2FA79